MSEAKPAATVHDPLTAIAIPKQVPARQGIADLPGTRLGYWDTGSHGTPVFFYIPLQAAR